MTSLQVLKSLTQVLERLRIPYMVGGWFASAAHGVPRSTLDADIVVELRLDQVADFARAFSGSDYVDEARIRAALGRGRAFNLIHLESSFKIDFFPLGKSAYQAKQFSRRRRERLQSPEGFEIYLSTAEDTVLSKLSGYRLGGEVSERQWLDVLGVLKVKAGELDEGYLRNWAAELGVADLLERAAKEAGAAGRPST